MQISDAMVSIAKLLRCQFVLKDQPISAEQVFATTGLLPAMTKRADQLATFCLGYGLGATYEDSSDSMLGSKVIFDDKTPNGLRVMCLTDVLIEFIQMAPSREQTPLDDLAYD